VLEVIEGEHELADHQRHIGQTERIGVRLAKRLDRSHEVVAEEPDGAARERRQLVQLGDLEAVHQAVCERIRIPVFAQVPGERRVGTEAQERIAAEPALLCRLEQECRAVECRTQFEERRDGRLAIVDEGVPDRDDVGGSRELASPLERRLDRTRRFSRDGH
jgi:hypothetical protein